jgi:hypothetical protein
VRRIGQFAVVLLLLALSAGRAAASNILPDADVKGVELAVNAQGYALVSYVTSSGKPRHLLLWGALNSNKPSESVKQVRFLIDYTGGYTRFHNGGYWKTFKNKCTRYVGPKLALLVAACRAPDGSYWAVQSWQRNLPLLGFDPWKPAQSAYEFHLSHWTGQVATLELYSHVTYGGQFQGVFGRLGYDGVPVHGFHATDTGNPNDSYGRNVYIDTYGSAYGPGWKRESGILVHNRTGTYCHSFVPQKPIAGYPSQEQRPAAPGKRYRATVIGPGVTPDLQVVASAPPTNDAGYNARLQATFDKVMAGDARCVVER